MSDQSIAADLGTIEGRRRLEFWEANPPGVGFVYMVQGERHTPVKVGYAVNPRKRLTQLQTGSYAELHILDLIPGPPSLERKLHKRLAPHRLRGEWFAWEAAIPAWLALRAVGEAMMTFYGATGRVPALETFDAWHQLLEVTR